MEISEHLDLRQVPCPANSARALVAMEILCDGEVIEILVDDGEPIDNLPVSLEQFGHEILSKEKQNDGHWRVLAKVQG